MPEQQDQNYGGDYGYSDPYSSSKIKDLEEKQNLLKDRLILIGENLIETKEEDSKKITELKRDVETIKEEIRKMKRFLEMVSEELSKFARKEDLEILSKQAKMFQPLNLIKRTKSK
jgi:archaellum component FlaC